MAKKEQKVKTKKEKKSKDKTSFFKGFKAELKKVSWPTPKQLVNNTIAVLAIVLLLSVIVFVLDIAFESVNKYGIDKIKESIVSSDVSEENTIEDEGQVEEDVESTDSNQNAETSNEVNTAE